MKKLLLALLVICAFGTSGCGSSGSQDVGSNVADQPTGPLHIAIVDDPKLAKTIGRLWAARADRELNVREITLDELLQAEKLQADIVVYPPAYLGHLMAKRQVLPMPPDRIQSDDFVWVDVLPVIRLQECTWNKQVYATPFGSRTLVLLYRSDIFDQLKMKPPETWQQYTVAAKQLRDHSKFAKLVSSKEWKGCLEPLQRGYAGQMLLARAATYARHSGQYSALFSISDMKPLIGGPPFVRALKELKSANTAASVTQNTLGTLQELIAGNCAMALSWPLAELDPILKKSSGKLPPISVSLIPGGEETYDVRYKKWEKRRESGGVVPLFAMQGRIGSVLRESKSRRAAFDALLLLCNKEWSELIAPTSENLTLFRRSHLFVSGRWVDERLEATAKAYGEVVEKTLSYSTSLPCLRIPGRKDYLKALDDAVLACVVNNESPQKALTAAAETWQKITEKLGSEKQRKAYCQSIGVGY